MCDDDVMSTNNVIPKMDDQAGEVCDSETTDFEEIEHNCDLCDFSSCWKNGLLLHISSSHENTDDKLKSSDEITELTQSYWKTGNLVSNMEVYINALMDIEKAKNVNDDIKTEEERKLEELWNDIQRLKS